MKPFEIYYLHNAMPMFLYSFLDCNDFKTTKKYIPRLVKSKKEQRHESKVTDYYPDGTEQKTAKLEKTKAILSVFHQ